MLQVITVLYCINKYSIYLYTIYLYTLYIYTIKINVKVNICSRNHWHRMLINYTVVEDFCFAKFSGEISLFSISDSNATWFSILMFYGSDMEETSVSAYLWCLG